MKKIEHTNASNYLFQRYGNIKLLYMDITIYDEAIYLKVINRKGLANVYLLEANDDVEKLTARIAHIYAKITESNLYYNYRSFEGVMIISQELTKNDKVLQSLFTWIFYLFKKK